MPTSKQNEVSESSLNSLKLEELRTIVRARGLPVTGVKEDLIRRITSTGTVSGRKRKCPSGDEKQSNAGKGSAGAGASSSKVVANGKKAVAGSSKNKEIAKPRNAKKLTVENYKKILEASVKGQDPGVIVVGKKQTAGFRNANRFPLDDYTKFFQAPTNLPDCRKGAATGSVRNKQTARSNNLKKITVEGYKKILEASVKGQDPGIIVVGKKQTAGFGIFR